MFALGIRYLNGWSMAAADGAKKQRVEWPPHSGPGLHGLGGCVVRDLGPLRLRLVLLDR